MSRKLLGLILVIGGLVAIGVVRTASKIQEPRAETTGSFKEKLALAKARGDKTIDSYSAIPIYAQVSLDDALAIYDLVIAEPLAERSLAIDDDGEIVTWYRFKVIETLSKANSPRPVETENVPAELLPLAEDEILVSKLGGIVNVDGVQIEMKEQGFPAFQKSQKYLLFLAFNSVNKVGYVDVGPSGVLVVKPDGTLESINKDRRQFQTQIENRFGTSVNSLKARLN